MRIGNFSVLVPEGREAGSGHVTMVHGTVYRIRLSNHGNLRCDAEVEVDGKSIGLFRIDGHGEFLLERPSHDTGRFTFFKSDSEEGRAAGAPDEAVRGVVTVRFKPELKPLYHYDHTQSIYKGTPSFPPRFSDDSAGGGRESLKTCSIGNLAGNRSAGHTGLTGESAQRFVTVANLNYDPVGEVTINLRLVCGDEPAVRPLTSAPRSNPVPSPIQ